MWIKTFNLDAINHNSLYDCTFLKCYVSLKYLYWCELSLQYDLPIIYKHTFDP